MSDQDREEAMFLVEEAQHDLDILAVQAAQEILERLKDLLTEAEVR